MKREERHQLKADHFIEIVNTAVKFVRKHQRNFMLGLGGIVVIFLVVLGVRFLQAKGLERENLRLARIIQLNRELPDKPENLAELEKMAGKGRFTRVAHLYIAIHHFEQQSYDAALAALDRIPDSRMDMIYYQGLALRAQIHSGRENYEQALAIYRDIEAQAPKDFPLEAILYSMAEIHVARQNHEQALILFKRIQDDFPQSAYAYDASREAAKLEEKK